VLFGGECFGRAATFAGHVVWKVVVLALMLELEQFDAKCLD
jgi:hypothetical protein